MSWKTLAPTAAPEPSAAPATIEVVEAILFVGGTALSAERFRQAFPEVAPARFEGWIGELRARYRRQQRPYGIRRTAAGYLLELLPEVRADLARRSRPDRGVKLARPVIEVLSIIAYRQPITAEQIARLVGSDVGPILRQLIRRQLIAFHEPAGASGPRDRYITTARFLELFNLETLADLPTVDDSRPRAAP